MLHSPNLSYRPDESTGMCGFSEGTSRMGKTYSVGRHSTFSLEGQSGIVFAVVGLVFHIPKREPLSIGAASTAASLFCLSDDYAISFFSNTARSSMVVYFCSCAHAKSNRQQKPQLGTSEIRNRVTPRACCSYANLEICACERIQLALSQLSCCLSTELPSLSQNALPMRIRQSLPENSFSTM
jgi:hypothetical protein